MSKIEYGFRRAITEMVSGIVVAVILQAFVSSGLIPYSYVLLFHLVNIVSTIALVFAIPYWATSYIIGWLIGLAIMSRSGLIGTLEFVIYFIPFFVLIARLVKKLRD